MIVDYNRRRLRFAIDSEGVIDARVTSEMLPDSVRPWVQAVYNDDAIVLSNYRWTPPKPPSKPATLEGAADNATGGAASEDGASPSRNEEPWWDNANKARLRAFERPGEHGGFGKAYASEQRQRGASASPHRVRTVGQCATTLPGTEGITTHAEAASLHQSTPTPRGGSGAEAADEAEEEEATPWQEVQASLHGYTRSREQLDRADSASRPRAERSHVRRASSPQPSMRTPPMRPAPHVRQLSPHRPARDPTLHTSQAWMNQASYSPPHAHQQHFESRERILSAMGTARSVSSGARTDTRGSGGGGGGSQAVRTALREARRESAVQSSVAAAEAQVVATLAGSAAGSTAWSRQQAHAAHAGQMHEPWSMERWLACGDGGVHAMGKEARLPSGTVSSRVTAAVAAALVSPLHATPNEPAPYPQQFLRALASQPDRRHAVMQLLRDGHVLERIAAEVCAAAEAFAEDEGDAARFRSGSERAGRDNWGPEA